ncbi:MAG: hypothetical protein IKJ74_03480 [Clostridia bacterium]|nr:hypothetical protein [Clostridia bacterium]
MKKILAVLLSLVMILALAACSAPAPLPKETHGGEKEDLSKLSAEELYERALSKTAGLVSARFETLVLLGEEEVDSIATVRVREGYDGFSYSREGTEKLYYNEGRICVENRLGDFAADTGARQVEEYMGAYWFPVSSISLEAVSGLEKEDMTVGFTLADEGILALFADAVPAERGVFVPQSLEGVCSISEEGLLEKQSFTVAGTLGGEETTLLLETELKEYRSESIEPAIPAAEHVVLSDIRIPHLIETGREGLEQTDTLQATLLSAETLTAGDAKWALHREWTYYQPDADTFYLSRQSLKKLPAPAEEGAVPVEESLFYQLLQQNGARTENEYDVILGEKKWENTGETAASPWKELVGGMLVSLSSLNELNMSEDLGKTSITFSLQNAGVRELVSRMAASLPEGGVDPAAVTATGSGVFTLDRASGKLTAFSVLVQGDTAGGQSLSCQYSFNLDAEEGITLPGLQTPTPTTPGQAVEENQDH